MPWITPVTDRTDGAYCTVTDMNRIAGNLDWLATELNTYQLYYGATVAKTTYVYNDSDEYWQTLMRWADILQRRYHGHEMTGKIIMDYLDSQSAKMKADSGFLEYKRREIA